MKTFLFDFDGTLVDSMPAFISSMLKILDDNGISYDDDIIKTITPLGVVGTAEYYTRLGVCKTVEEIIEDMKDYMLEDYRFHIKAKKNVVEVLKGLKEKGFCLNVLTASPHISLDPCLKRLLIYDLFDNVWSCDDFGTSKADPEIYRAVAEKLGQKTSHIMFLDDNLNALSTAKKAGMKICGVYDDSSKDDEEKIRAVANFYVKDFAELMDII